MQRKFEKYIENNEKDTTYQNICDAAKTMLKWEFIGVNAYIQNEDKSQINNPTFHLKTVEKEERTCLKPTERRK